MKLLCLVLFISQSFSAFSLTINETQSIYYQAFKQLYEKGQFNGAILIAKNGKILLNTHFGDADKLNKTSLSADSLYRLASVSKTITATALLTLVDAEMLSLNDKVKKFLPQFPYSEITISQILQHSSGLPDYIFGVGEYWNDDNGLMSNQDVLKWLVKTKPTLAFKEGEGWEYCNTGYALIPLIIEKVTNGSYQEYLRKSVFNKADMKNSYHITEIGQVDAIRIAKGHGFDYAAGQDLRADKHFMLANEFKTNKIYGAGDVYSTAKDLLSFDQALKANKIISADLQDKAYTSFFLPEGFPAGYGLGWQVAESEFTGRIIHHHGQGDGYRTRYYRFIDKDITIITLQNAREKYADEVVRIAQELTFKGNYDLPKISLAEELSLIMVKEGINAVTNSVVSASDNPEQWHLNQRDLNNFAFTYWYQGKRKLAIKLLSSYLKLMPSNPNVYMTLAEAFEEENDKQQSSKYYKTALEIANEQPSKYATEIKQLKKIMSQKI